MHDQPSVGKLHGVADLHEEPETVRDGEPLLVGNPMVQITAAAYAEPGTAVYVLSPSGNFPYFQ